MLRTFIENALEYYLEHGTEPNRRFFQKQWQKIIQNNVSLHMRHATHESERTIKELINNLFAQEISKNQVQHQNIVNLKTFGGVTLFTRNNLTGQILKPDANLATHNTDKKFGHKTTGGQETPNGQNVASGRKQSRGRSASNDQPIIGGHKTAKLILAPSASIRGQYINIWAKRYLYEIFLLYPILAGFKDIHFPRIDVSELYDLSFELILFNKPIRILSALKHMDHIPIEQVSNYSAIFATNINQRFNNSTTLQGIYLVHKNFERFIPCYNIQTCMQKSILANKKHRDLLDIFALTGTTIQI